MARWEGVEPCLGYRQARSSRLSLSETEQPTEDVRNVMRVAKPAEKKQLYVGRETASAELDREASVRRSGLEPTRSTEHEDEA